MVHMRSIDAGQYEHIPVLCDEAICHLNIRNGGRYVDGTFGKGGYASRILEAASCQLFAIDRDPMAFSEAMNLSERYAERLIPVQGCFGEMDSLLAARGIKKVDSIVLDLGVSSLQLDDPSRGFSFRFDGPLDMRMGKDGVTAGDIVNSMTESDLADLIYTLGEERYSRRVSRAIVEARVSQPISSTGALAKIIRDVVPYKKFGQGIDPATKTFQALRIYVNDELSELDKGLEAAERLLNPGGRLVIVAFHSLEDRRVKNFFNERQGKTTGRSRYLPPGEDSHKRPSFSVITKRPVRPSAAELKQNPRARSARLRVAERTAAAPWSEFN